MSGEGFAIRRAAWLAYDLESHEWVSGPQPADDVPGYAPLITSAGCVCLSSQKGRDCALSTTPHSTSRSDF